MTENPQNDIEVEPVGTEARRDEWGFPSVAGRLSECGGACASHSEADQLGQPTELIAKLLRVDVVEAYAPPHKRQVSGASAILHLFWCKF